MMESPCDFVFPGRNGRPLNTRKMFEKARKDADLSDLWFHDLRKAFVTYARGAGHPDKTVAALAGHRDMRVSDLYTLPTEAQMRAAVESIPTPGAAHLQPAPDPPVDPPSATAVESTSRAHSSVGQST